MTPTSADKILPPTPLARRYVRLLLGFTVGVAIGMAPFLGNVEVPGFRALLNVMPFQIQYELVSLSAFFMGMVAVAVQFYAAEEISRPVLRKRFGFALIALVVGFFLFVILRNLFTVSVERGDRHVTVLYGPSPLKDCGCGNPRNAAACIKELSLDKAAIASCWDEEDLKKRGLILEISYLLLTGGLGGLIGILFLQIELIQKEQKEQGEKEQQKKSPPKPRQRRKSAGSAAKKKAAAEEPPGGPAGSEP